MLYEANNNTNTRGSRCNVYAKEIYSLIKMSFDQIEEIRERQHLLSIDDRFLFPFRQSNVIFLEKDEHISEQTEGRSSENTRLIVVGRLCRISSFRTLTRDQKEKSVRNSSRQE